MDRALHKRYLDYRETFVYFGRGGMVMMSAAEFTSADEELRLLDATGQKRTPEEEQRKTELDAVLFRS